MENKEESLDSGREKTEEDILKERKEKLLEFIKTKTEWIYYAVLAVIVWLNWKLRTIPVPKLIDVTTGEYTIGPDLDPFLFLRYAKFIVENGYLMANDAMRYVPLGFNTAIETRLLPYMMAYFHYFLSFFKNVSVEYSAIIFPAFMSIFTAIFFFLFVREVFESKGKHFSNITALIATAFLVVIPSLLTRTIAGIPEKESVGFMLLIMSFYFFVLTFKTSKFRNAIIFGVLAGVATGALGLVWGGVIYAFTTISIAAFLGFVLNKFDKNKFFGYFSWFIVFIFVLTFFTNRYSIINLATSTSSGLSFVVMGILFVDFVLFKPKIKESHFVQKLKNKKLPDRFISILLAAVFILLIAIIWFGPGFLFNFIGDIVESLTTPYTDRLSFTIAENRQPFFAGEWRNSFGPIFNGIPLFFWLFFIGSILLFDEMIKKIEKNKRLILLLSYIIFIFALVFSKYSATSVLDGNTFISKVMYFGGIAVLLVSGAYVYYGFAKENKLNEFRKINFGYLFIISYFVISLLAARSAVRLIMGLVPASSAIVGYFSVAIVDKARKNKDDLMKLITIGIAIIVVIATLYSLNIYYQSSQNTAQGYVPDRYRVQWQQAMGWVRENTPEDAVFSHWWDYGYWVQTMGERATVLDGGNAIAYWDYLMGRHVLTAETEREALEFMYTYDSEYLLIDSTEIGKYGAYSSIGSDENYDRYSWISSYVLNEQATQEQRNETFYFYQGGTALDEDYVHQENGNQILFPARRAGVGALVLKIKKDGTFNQPSMILVYQNQQAELPLRYLYYNESLIDFGSGYEGTLYIIPRIIQSNEGIRLNELGSALFLSERNVRALWVQLYLLGQGEDFELVHNEPSLLISNLRSQGLVVGDFAYFNGNIEGPIKIWKAEIPEDIEKNPQYLERQYPKQELAEATLR